MSKSMIERIIGDLGEKRDYRRFMKRVNALPKEYRFAFKKIRHYLYSSGSAGHDMAIFNDLLYLFEASAADGRQVLDVIGGDVSGFCDELVRASAPDAVTLREKLNQDVLEHFHKEEN